MSFDFYELFKYATIVFLLIVASVLVLNLLVVSSAKKRTFNNLDDLTNADVVIILGAGVYQNGKLTPILKDRVDAAMLIYKDGLAPKILVSGDNGQQDYNEVIPIWEYLVAAGIPQEDIFLDYAGFDTYDSMYRASAVFEVDSAIVVTQSFHLPRAIFIANALGIDIQGFSPVKDKGTFYNSFRELAARVKAVMDLVTQSSPTYLGERIPISGDGRKTLND